MIVDREMLLTPKEGQLFNAADTNSEYGSAPYDLKATTYGGNPAIGEGLVAFGMVVDSDSDVGTSLEFDIVADDDGAGTNEVSLLSGTKTKVVADLQVADGVFRIGALDPSVALAATNQYITAKVTTHGTAATAGKVRIWLQPDQDGAPNNEGVSI